MFHSPSYLKYYDSGRVFKMSEKRPLDLRLTNFLGLEKNCISAIAPDPIPSRLMLCANDITMVIRVFKCYGFLSSYSLLGLSFKHLLKYLPKDLNTCFPIVTASNGELHGKRIFERC